MCRTSDLSREASPTPFDVDYVCQGCVRHRDQLRTPSAGLPASVIASFSWLVIGAILVVLPQCHSGISGTLCSANGMKNLNGTCSCFNGFTGPSCTKRVCRAGRAWADWPSAQDKAHAVRTECSNMGLCDRTTGKCVCRAGFEGAACERMACPSSNNDTCSGHGLCMTMAQAASSWNGHSLVRPSVTYTSNWDANMVRGCVCDYGWTGYDCRYKECPRGDDPSTSGGQNEVLRIACQADSGSFTFTFRGQTTAAIPYDAPYGLLQHRLESLATIKSVLITFSTGSTVCGSSEVVTSIEFLQDFGDLPAATVTTVDLGLTSSTPTLEMQTTTTILCPACVTCSGYMYLIYEGEITSALAYSAAPSDVQTALAALTTLMSTSAYGAASSVTVTGTSSTICDSLTSATLTIDFRSTYSNLPNMTLVNSIYDSGTLASLVMTPPKGTKENDYCSNHGTCDFVTGSCTCDRNATSYPYQWYWYESSDGYGGSGTRPDCGYKHSITPTSGGVDQTCPVGKSYVDTTLWSYLNIQTRWCSGRGTCNDATAECDCFDGFFGGDCSLRSCPTGKAWFDEAYAVDSAHAAGAECSNAGYCDYTTGTCVCRSGWTGANCQYLSCPNSCSGHGRCLAMWQLGLGRDVEGVSSPVSYGTTSYISPYTVSSYAQPATWDYDMMQMCACDSRDEYQPRTGSPRFYSGHWQDNVRLSGWTGYDCSLRTCPTGDNPLTLSGVNEVQTIACTDTTGTFMVSFRSQVTSSISVTADEDAITTALGALTTIGSVTVTFSGSAACDATYVSGQGIQVTFTTEYGDLPLMTAAGSSGDYIVDETTPGTKENDECSGTGDCDYTTGLCQCKEGFSSDDGYGTGIYRGDCGHIDPFCRVKG